MVACVVPSIYTVGVNRIIVDVILNEANRRISFFSATIPVWKNRTFGSTT